MRSFLWIVRAEYGTINQRNDVTETLKDLIARGGMNGRVAVSNQTMGGGDPAVGADQRSSCARCWRVEDSRYEDEKAGNYQKWHKSMSELHEIPPSRMPPPLPLIYRRNDSPASSAETELF